MEVTLAIAGAHVHQLAARVNHNEIKSTITFTRLHRRDQVVSRTRVRTLVMVKSIRLTLDRDANLQESTIPDVTDKVVPHVAIWVATTTDRISI